MAKKGRPPKNTQDVPQSEPMQNIAPTKKAATKKTTKSAASTSSSFDLFEKSDDLYNQTQEALLSMSSEKNNDMKKIVKMSDIQKSFIRLPHFGLQVLFDSIGLQTKTIVELLGAESSGKSSLIYTIFGYSIFQNSPCLYVNTESKWLDENRAKQLLSSNKELADKMHSTIHTTEAFELQQMVDTIETWADAMRNKIQNPVPKSVPLVIAVDSLSKLMAPSDAVGYVDYKNYSSDENTKKAHQLNEGSNLEFPKLLHKWCCRLPSWISNNNVLLLLVSHQNQKINMSPFGGGGDTSPGLNKTKRGGNALNQNTLNQITLKYTGMIKNTNKDVIGKTIVARMVKNTLGAEHRELEYKIDMMPPDADPEMPVRKEAIDFNEGLANYFVNHNLLNTKVSRKRYSSDVLGVVSVTASEFVEALHNDKNAQLQVARILGLSGFEDLFELENEQLDNDVAQEENLEEKST